MNDSLGDIRGGVCAVDSLGDIRGGVCAPSLPEAFTKPLIDSPGGFLQMLYAVPGYASILIPNNVAAGVILGTITIPANGLTNVNSTICPIALVPASQFTFNITSPGPAGVLAGTVMSVTWLGMNFGETCTPAEFLIGFTEFQRSTNYPFACGTSENLKINILISNLNMSKFLLIAFSKLFCTIARLVRSIRVPTGSIV